MKLIAVCRRRLKPRMGDFCDSVRAVQFDGFALRGNFPLGLEPIVAYWSEDRTPLDCSRHGKFVPDIFQPEAEVSWVVSEQVKNFFESLIPCEFLQVNFRKLIDYPVFPETEFDSEEYPEIYVPPDLIYKLPDAPELHEQIGNYYELLEPVSRVLIRDSIDINVEFAPITKNDIYVDEMNYSHDVEFSERMFDKFPIVYANRFRIMRVDIFKNIEHFFNWNYFAKIELEI